MPHHEAVRETAAVMQIPEEEEGPLSTNGQSTEAPYEQGQPESDEEEEEAEGAGSEPEAPLEDIPSEPAEPGTWF